jgi:hypothetical protein
MKERTTIKTAIIINASPEQVWEVLTDFKKLDTWSTSFQGLEGDFCKDGEIEVAFKSPFGGLTKMKKKLFQFEEGRSFAWTGVFLLGMSDYHIHSVKELPNGQTEFSQEDGLQGGASFLLGKVLEKQMQKAYVQFNQELKNVVERKIKASDE